MCGIHCVLQQSAATSSQRHVALQACHTMPFHPSHGNRPTLMVFPLNTPPDIPRSQFSSATNPMRDLQAQGHAWCCARSLPMVPAGSQGMQGSGMLAGRHTCRGIGYVRRGCTSTACGFHAHGGLWHAWSLDCRVNAPVAILCTVDAPPLNCLRMPASFGQLCYSQASCYTGAEMLRCLHLKRHAANLLKSTPDQTH